MVTLIDTVSAKAVRHPEKQNRPETPVLRKPEWLRVKAPGSAGYNETRGIVRDHKLVTVCVKKRPVRTSASAGPKSTRP